MTPWRCVSVRTVAGMSFFGNSWTGPWCANCADRFSRHAHVASGSPRMHRSRRQRPLAGTRLGAYDEPWLDLQYELYSVADFVRLDGHAPLLAAAEQILGRPAVSASTVACRIMSPHAAELTTPPHQDRFYFPHAEGLWTAWIPLGDTPLRCGGLAVLEGSHRMGLLPHSDRGAGVYGAEMRSRRPWRTTSYRAGDVLLFHSLTVHRALDNVSDELRISVDLRYVPADDEASASRTGAPRATSDRS